MPLTVSWQPCVDSAPTGFNLIDLWNHEATVERWPEFIAQYSPEWHAHFDVIRQSIIDNQVWAGGDWHQYSTHGMPVVSDGHYVSCTWREWGELLAAVWSSELGQPFTYMDFYMEGRLPERPAAWASSSSPTAIPSQA